MLKSGVRLKCTAQGCDFAVDKEDADAMFAAAAAEAAGAGSPGSGPAAGTIDPNAKAS